MLKFKNYFLIKENVKTGDLINNNLIKAQEIEKLITPTISGLVDAKNKILIIKFFIALYLSENLTGVLVSSKIQSDISNFIDFITYQLNKNKSFFAVLRSRQELEQENIKYHNSLATKFGKGEKGLVVLKIQEELNKLSMNYNLSEKYNSSKWANWSWISLGKRRCNSEAAAGGHCGNSGGSAFDNIFSLRDGSNKVYLTFIVNNGILKEAKANFNKKPTEEFHPAILTLLMSKYIINVKTNIGYIPENNFKLNDLEPELQEIINKKLKNQTSHELPVNYENNLDQIDNINQNDIDKLSPKEKVKLLLKIVTIFDNGLHLRDYEKVPIEPDENSVLDYEHVYKTSVKKPKINFDFNKLIDESLDVMNNKQFIEFLQKFETLDVDNTISNKSSADLWGSEINQFKIKELKLNTLMEEKICKSILNRDLSINDSKEILDVLRDLFYFDDEETESNRYQHVIDALENKTLNKLLEKNKIESGDVYSDLFYRFLNNYLYSDKIELPKTHIGYKRYKYPKSPDALKDYFLIDNNKSIVFNLGFHYKHNEKINEDKINEIYKKVFHVLIKNGVPSNSKKIFIDCVKKEINSIIESYFLKLKTNEKLVKYRLRIRNKEDLYSQKTLMVKFDSIEILKQIKNKNLYDLEYICQTIIDYQKTLIQKINLKLEKIIIKNMSSIIQCMKKQK